MTTHLKVNRQKRKRMSTVAKAFIASGFIAAGGGSFSAYAFGDPWTEIARGIAQGIAEFTKKAFEQFSQWWEDTQRENDEKVTAAKGRAEDSKIDFRVQIENLKRVNRVKPTSNLCNTESESVNHHVEVEKEKVESVNTTPEKHPGNAVIGNEYAAAPNKGVSVLGNNGGQFSISTLITETSKIERKLATRQPLSQTELGAYSKVVLGKTGARALQPLRDVAKQSDTIARNPNIAEKVNASSVNAAAMTFATKLFTEAIDAEKGGFIQLTHVEKQTIKTIGKRYDEQNFRAELTQELNEVALTAEYLKLLGEHIYVLNAQFKQNQKFMAALAMEIIVNDQEIA